MQINKELVATTLLSASAAYLFTRRTRDTANSQAIAVQKAVISALAGVAVFFGHNSAPATKWAAYSFMAGNVVNLLPVRDAEKENAAMDALVTLGVSLACMWAALSVAVIRSGELKAVPGFTTQGLTAVLVRK